MNIKLFTVIAAVVCGMGFVSCDDDDNINMSDLPTAIQKEFLAMWRNGNRRTVIRSLNSVWMVLNPKHGLEQTVG